MITSSGLKHKRRYHVLKQNEIGAFLCLHQTLGSLYHLSPSVLDTTIEDDCGICSHSSLNTEIIMVIAVHFTEFNLSF